MNNLRKWPAHHLKYLKFFLNQREDEITESQTDGKYTLGMYMCRKPEIQYLLPLNIL